MKSHVELMAQVLDLLSFKEKFNKIQQKQGCATGGLD